MELTERYACIALAGCRFAPATWDKRFVRDMNDRLPQGDRPGNPAPLTPAQRDSLWRLVHRYRRQLGQWTQEMREVVLRGLAEGGGIPGERGAFEMALSSSPWDWSARLVYADWLEELGDHDLATAQRWMVDHRQRPTLSNAGQGYGPGDPYPINWQWLWDYETWSHFGVGMTSSDYLSRWHRSRIEAEAGLSFALAGKFGVAARGGEATGGR